MRDTGTLNDATIKTPFFLGWSQPDTDQLMPCSSNMKNPTAAKECWRRCEMPDTSRLCRLIFDRSTQLSKLQPPDRCTQ